MRSFISIAFLGTVIALVSGCGGGTPNKNKNLDVPRPVDPEPVKVDPKAPVEGAKAKEEPKAKEQPKVKEEPKAKEELKAKNEPTKEK